MVSQLHRCLCCTWLTLWTAASHPHTLQSRAVSWNKCHQTFSARTRAHTCDTSNAYFTPWQNIYYTQLHNRTLSHTHTHSIGASVQFLNGPAVRVRLMASQTPPSAFILVHLSHRPLYGAQQGSETSKRTLCFPEPASLHPRTKNKHCSLLFVQIVVPADIAVNDVIMFGPRRLGFGWLNGWFRNSRRCSFTPAVGTDELTLQHELS